MAQQKFEPEEVELRQTLADVRQKVGVLHGWLKIWVDRLEHADQIVFAFDREGWDADYAGRQACAAAMLGLDATEGYLDDDTEHSPRWLALQAASKP